YYTRTEKGAQYPIHCRRKGSLEAEEQVVLDLNELARGLSYFDLGSYTVSDNGRLLAFSVDTTGFRQYALQVKDLTSGVVSGALAERTGSVAWAADNATLFYTVEDEAKRQYRVYRHRLGTDAHELVYEEPDESFSVALYRGRSRLFLYLLSESLTTSEWRILGADRPAGEWRIVEPRREGIEYSVDDDRERFHLLVNDTGRNFRLVTAPLDAPGKAHWTEVIPARPDVMLEGIELFERFSVRYERAHGLPRLIVGDRQEGTERPVEFPEPTYTIFPARNAEFSAPGYRYEYTSLVTPRSTFEYSFEGRASALLKQQEVLGGFRASDYRSERIEARAPDGAAVPISLVYRAGTPLDGTAPCLLEGYGAYGYSSDPYFSSTRLSLLDRGVIFALAHVRGGGEMGKPWH
ncbi:MAG: oligopeptidase B, partial [Candidatus Eisenbacteria bacterium]|nr:oligopeptidase B [Candidatus Eisenbacteria bacterium]